jgi:hypothetical protein
VGSFFFLVGAPAAIIMGYLSHSHNRRNLLFLVVILGKWQLEDLFSLQLGSI